MSPIESLGIALILLACAIPVVALFLVIYLAIRLKHKRIMAAIEKGTPLSEIRPLRLRRVGPLWIKPLSLGIGLLIFSVGYLVTGLVTGEMTEEKSVMLAVPAIAVALIVWGLLYRKYSTQNPDGSCNSVTPNTSQP